MDKKVVIVGAGITGLSAAWYLEKAGIKNIILLEAQERSGGKIKTTTEEGFIIESGADSFVTTKPYALDLIDEIGLSDELINPKTTRFYFLKNGKLINSPNGLKMMAVVDKESFMQTLLFTEEGKNRILNEAQIPSYSSSDDESLGNFVRRRFGDEMLENYAEPLFGGIYSTPIDELSIEASFPIFKMMEKKYGSLTDAAFAQANSEKETSSNRSGFMSLKNGIQSLIDSLVSQLKHTQIIYNSKIINVHTQNKGEYIIETKDKKYYSTDVILTLPPKKLNRILNFKNDKLKLLLDEFSFSSSHIVTLAYPLEEIKHNMEATGYVVPLNENTPVSASTWSSSKWAYRAPENYALIRCFFDEEYNNHSDEELIRFAHQTMKSLLDITSDFSTKNWVSHYAHSLPQYKVGHYSRLRNLRELFKKEYPNVELAGSSYEGVGIPDCIKQGKNAAHLVSDR